MSILESDNSNKRNKRAKQAPDKQRKSAMEAAAAYLASRMRTVQEVRTHLKSKGYGSAEIDEAVSELIGLRYLDDYVYAVRYYEYSREKGRGSRRSMRELEEKGIDSETIRNAYDDYVYENKIDEFREALQVAEKELYVLPDSWDNGDVETSLVMKEVDDRLLAKIARKLENRGYGNDDIYKVLAAVRSRAAEDKGYN